MVYFIVLCLRSMGIECKEVGEREQHTHYSAFILLSSTAVFYSKSVRIESVRIKHPRDISRLLVMLLIIIKKSVEDDHREHK